MKSKILFLTIALAVVTLSTCDLRFVFKLVSEGAKSPLYVNDANRDLFTEEWTYGPGVLTPVGYRMLYLLGTKDRQTYSSFLSSNYKSNEVYVRSGNTNSTLMSADAYLQGLFPPGTGPELTPSQRSRAFPPTLRNFGGFDVNSFGAAALPRRTQVVPVHTFDNQDKKYFFFNFDICTNAIGKFDKGTKEDVVDLFLENFKNTYGTNLLKVLNLSDEDDFLDYDLVFNIMNTFIADYTEGKILKRFTDNGIDLRAFNQTAYEFLANDLIQVKNSLYNEEPFLPNATMSAFRDEIKMWFSNRVNNDRNRTGYTPYSAPKYVLFSVPDYTVSAMIAYLSRNKGVAMQNVTMASSLTFELRMKDTSAVGPTLNDSDYDVYIIFNGATLRSFSLTEFTGILDSAWDEEEVRKSCSNNLVEKYGYKNATITLGVLLGVAFLILIIVLTCCILDRKRKQAEHDPDYKPPVQTIPEHKTEVAQPQQEEVKQNN
jgi:hypothetical protein